MEVHQRAAYIRKGACEGLQESKIWECARGALWVGEVMQVCGANCNRSHSLKSLIGTFFLNNAW